MTSKIYGNKEEVYRGVASYTPGGLSKRDLTISGKGKVVSKLKSSMARRNNNLGRFAMKGSAIPGFKATRKFKGRAIPGFKASRSFGGSLTPMPHIGIGPMDVVRQKSYMYPASYFL